MALSESMTNHVTTIEGNGIQVTYARWGAGPRWHGTARVIGTYLTQVSHWFENEADAAAWATRCVTAEPGQAYWDAAYNGQPRT